MLNYELMRDVKQEKVEENAFKDEFFFFKLNYNIIKSQIGILLKHK